MLIYPNIDPIAIDIGPLSVHWYGLMYLVAFVLFMVLGRIRARHRPEMGWNKTAIDDLLFYGVLGVIVGARLGEVVFFNPGHFFAWPEGLSHSEVSSYFNWILKSIQEIFSVWKGGMSFHGGFLGVLVAMWIYARRRGRTFWEVTDFIAPMVPIGLAAGRIGNFINGELYGKPMSEPYQPWAMIYPHVDQLPRHPSQLYQASGEGLLLFIALWIYAWSSRPLRNVSAFFLVGYGVLRFIAEFFRTRDPGIFDFLGLGLSTAQWLCVPMIVIGIALFAHNRLKSRLS